MLEVPIPVGPKTLIIADGQPRRIEAIEDGEVQLSSPSAYEDTVMEPEGLKRWIRDAEQVQIIR